MWLGMNFNSCELRYCLRLAAAQVILTGKGRNFCGGIDLSVAHGILKGVTQAECPSRAREQLRRNILAMQVPLLGSVFSERRMVCNAAVIAAACRPLHVQQAGDVMTRGAGSSQCASAQTSYIK